MVAPLEVTREQGTRRDPVGPPVDLKRPAPGDKAPSVKQPQRNRPIKYPIQLKVNITPPMAAALQRVCQRLGKGSARASRSRNFYPCKTPNSAAGAMPEPDQSSLEDIRLAVARRRVEARDNAVKENITLLEQLARARGLLS